MKQKSYLSSYDKFSVKQLNKKLKKSFVKLEKKYKSVINNTAKTDNQKVLYENFYILHKIYKEVIKTHSNEKIITVSDMPLIGSIIVLNSNENEFASANIISEQINEVYKKIQLKNIDFELILWQVKYTLLMNFCASINDKKSDINALNVLILISKSDTIDVQEIINNSNKVHKIYASEKSNIYSKMNKETQSIYRNRTAYIAKKQKKSEIDIANNFLSAADKFFTNLNNAKESHVGYYIFKDYESLFKKVNIKNYTMFICFLSVFISLVCSFFLNNYYILILLLIPFAEIIKIIVDLFVKYKKQITYLPRMSLSNNIPDNAKTTIVISTIISTCKDIKELKQKIIEQNFLNVSDNIKICVLCDLSPSNKITSANDDVIIRNCERTINGLNKRFNNRFIIIIRNRTFSKTQNMYIGFDRKRGAIEELACFAKSEQIDFKFTCGDTDFIKDSKYFLCLDYDTKPFMETACELISIAQHPLNKPVIQDNKVINGYGIITPRITTKLSSSLKTPFTKFVGGIGSSSAYDNCCPDFYQDCFNAGIFSGKGLINIDSFYKVCTNIFLPEEILSHDIIEGELLRTGFAGDIIFSEQFPSKSESYFKRLHRWIRGDIQNINFLGKKIKTKKGFIKNPLKYISKFKLLDNIKRILFPINLIIIILVSAFVNINTALLLMILALVSLKLPYCISLISSIFNNGFYNITRKYYSNVISETTEIISKSFFSVIFLPQQALTSLDASIRALWRKYISKKNLLEWTTAYSAEQFVRTTRVICSNYLLPFIIGIILLISKLIFIKIVGMIFVISPLIIFYCNRPYKDRKNVIDKNTVSKLINQLSNMYHFYEDYANKENNYLPPDNVQFAPIFRVCNRTSPTNIGLMLLSELAARDFELIDTDELAIRIDRALKTVENLKKYKGNLYNWYETKTLKVSNNPYVSSVDSGNFLCCMVALKEGLVEYKNKNSIIPDLIIRINNIIDNTDIGFFYDKIKNLFYIGFNPETEKFSPNHYDMLMSEARMTSYFAISKRLVPKKHWHQLGRIISKNGLYSGTVSYTGTMFEYFMPELLLSSKHGSICYEGLKYCLYCQKQRTKKSHMPYGISESGYYAFDNILNYQYKAHGVQKSGLRKGLDNELVVSPYSTYITLQYDLKNAIENIDKLKSFGLEGYYGLYEAIDFTKSVDIESGSIVKSYMAHHIGMSIIGISNALQDGKMQKRFIKDRFMKSGEELLEEKIMSGVPVYEDLYRKPETERVELNEEDDKMYFEEVHPYQQNIKLLFNGEYTLALSDIGAAIAIYQGLDIYGRTTDVLKKPEGSYYAVQDGKKHFCFSYLPEYNNNDKMSVEFNKDTISYYSNSNELLCGMKVHLHNNMPCEIRQFALKNTSKLDKKINLLCYIQPRLATYREYSAHQMFSKLFLKEVYDKENDCIIVSRKNRYNDEMTYCAIGFIESLEFECNLSREDVVEKPYGVRSVFLNKENTKENLNYIPDPSVFIDVPIKIKQSDQFELNLFILVSRSKEELYQNIAKLRSDKYIYTLSKSNINYNSIEGRLISTILPQILYNKFDCKENLECIKNNELSLCSLWQFGISGDLPIVYVHVCQTNSVQKIEGYIKAHKLLKLCGIEFDLVFSFNDKGDENRYLYNNLLKTISDFKSADSVSQRSGIHLIDIFNVDSKIINLLKAVSVHIAPESMARVNFPMPKYTPVEFLPVNKPQISIENPLTVGGFDNNKYIINQETQVPWCNVHANSSFGTLVSNSALGYTYAINSRENKLTPWYNDTKTDNQGEMIILKIEDNYYDLVFGSVAIFSQEKSEYIGITNIFKSKVIVLIDKKSMCKKISVEIDFIDKYKNISIAYYTEPTLSVSRDNSKLIVFSKEDNCILAKNPLNTEISGFMCITSDKEYNYVTTNRLNFLSGNWQQNSLLSQNNPCLSFITNYNDNTETIKQDFYLSFGKTKDKAKNSSKDFVEYKDEKQNTVTIKTPDVNLDNMFNIWLNHQTLSGRIMAKTGFYQNSGACGFRDQLQDSCAALITNPSITKKHILLACTAQFEEGDVLHWWHSLPNNIIRGVRTRYSDDLVWLPYTVCEYVEKTMDMDILLESAPFCEGISLKSDEHEIYGEVKVSDISENVYSHCKKALEQAYKLGEHGLVLIGCGDWNDSFNKIGIEGKGESVWLSEFMVIVFEKFAEIAKFVSDAPIYIDYTEKAANLRKAISENCWDGEWYLRAFFDNGDELGSKNCEACQIDSLAQSFATLCRLPDTKRNKIALNSAYDYLVDKDNMLIKLFTPAFRKNELPVGYATSYPAGIRENGGQYTHAAIWLAIAFFEAGLKEKGFELINLLNPSNKYLNDNKEVAEKFKNEPYFMTADIYTNPMCYGRGGWSIYTGAAAWYYRAIFEWLFGIKIKFGYFYIDPFLPEDWNEYEINLNYQKTTFHIVIKRGSNHQKYDNDREFDKIKLDGKHHEIIIIV